MPHILLVEDDTHLKHSVCQLLEDHGFQVTTAAHGMEALLLISSLRSIDLVVLDLMMPTFSGWEFLRELRAHPQQGRTPVLVASAFSDAPVGFDIQGFIRKPFTGSEFVKLVTRLTASPRLEQSEQVAPTAVSLAGSD